MELYVPGGGFGSSETSRSGGVVLIVVMRVGARRTRHSSAPRLASKSRQNIELKNQRSHKVRIKCIKSEQDKFAIGKKYAV